MTVIQATVRKNALLKLGVGSIGQTPTSDLDSDMTDAYNEIYAYLEANEQTFWGQTSAIPDEVADPLATWMAWSRVNNYSISNERYQRLSAEFSRAERQIKEMAVNNYLSTREVEDF